MSKEYKYPCPACGFLVFDYQPKDYQVCPLCEINENNAMNKIIEKPVKGDWRGYIISLIALTLSISILLFLYYKLNPIFMGIWGARSGWYMDEYRTWGEGLENALSANLLLDVPYPSHLMDVIRILTAISF